MPGRMRKLVALASLNDQGSLDEDVADAMVALAQEYARDGEGIPEVPVTDPPEPEDPAAEPFNRG